MSFDRVFTLTSLCAVLASGFAAHAQAGVERGAYAGRAGLGGQPTIEWESYPAGTLPLAQQGSRLAGNQLFAGYRFESGLGVEAMQYETAARDLNSSTDLLGIAGTLAVPLADKWVGLAKAGLHVPESDLALAAGRPALLIPEKLLGIGVAYRAQKNVDLTVQSQRLEGRIPQALATPAHTFLIGAHLTF